MDCAITCAACLSEALAPADQPIDLEINITQKVVVRKKPRYISVFIPRQRLYNDHYPTGPPGVGV